jgi:RNA polymerase sigma factor (sigma-70 family)
MDELIDLCRREHPRLVGMLGLYCGDRDVAEDLAQETLIRLCRDWRKVRKLDAPERWIHRVAINLAHSHYRRRSVEKRAFVVLGSRAVTETAASSDIESLELLKELPHKQRAALILHHYLDLTMREVSEVMDIPEGTVKTLIHRATRSIRERETESEASDAN